MPSEEHASVLFPQKRPIAELYSSLVTRHSSLIMHDFLTICEVGLRDGLQNEKNMVGTADKLALLDGLVDAGLTYIETSSYVRPDAVPQMADGDEMMQEAHERYGHDPRMHFTGLVFNNRGYDRALSSGCKAIAIAMSVSETFSQRNGRMSLRKALDVSRGLIRRAKADGVWVRVYLSTAWVCPFEGYTPPERTVALSETIWAEGIDELALADTIGYADPVAVGNLMELLGRRLGMRRLAVHLHDTQAMGMANASAAIQAGVRIVDSSLAGLGGCPFAPGAAGNLATEDLAFLAYKLGMGTGVDFDKLMETVASVEGMIGRPLGGRIRPWWDINRELR